MSRVIAVVGPTAAGKSALAVAVAERLGGSVLSVDSMQVYRGMDIGTAKADGATRARVPHHMIDVVDPEDEYTVAEFQGAAREILAAADRPVVVAGGSGLHFRSVVDPFRFPPHDPAVRREVEALGPDRARTLLLEADPDAGSAVDLANPRRVARALEILRLTGSTPSARRRHPDHRAVDEYRPTLAFTAFGLDPGNDLAPRVVARIEEMREIGLLEEVRGLADRLGRTAAQAVGYRQLLPVVAGRREVDEGFAATRSATLTLARRQRTYFRRDPRIRWLPWTADVESLADRVAAVVEEPTCTS